MIRVNKGKVCIEGMRDVIGAELGMIFITLLKKEDLDTFFVAAALKSAGDMLKRDLLEEIYSHKEKLYEVEKSRKDFEDVIETIFGIIGETLKDAEKEAREDKNN